MIPPKDIRFVRQKAFRLLSEGKDLDDLRQLIQAEGGDDEQVTTLPVKFMDDYTFLQQESGKQVRKTGDNYLIAGGVILGCGLLLTTISYFSMDGQGVVYFWGIVMAGILLCGLDCQIKGKYNGYTVLARTCWLRIREGGHDDGLYAAMQKRQE